MLLSEDEYGIEFELNDTCSLRVSITTEEIATPQKHTVLGWCVPDIYESVKFLESKNKQFERYDFLSQDTKGFGRLQVVLKCLGLRILTEIYYQLTKRVDNPKVAERRISKFRPFA
jgi:hypothetical protein